MSDILGATVPVFLVVLLGAALSYRAVIGREAWQRLQALNYFLFIPAMFLSGLASADFADAALARIVVVTAVALGAGTGAVWLWHSRKKGRHDLGPQLLDAAIRANVPYGMGLSLALGGQAGLHLFLVAAATYLPTVVLAGGLFAQLAGRRDGDPETEQRYALVSAFRLLAQNPIVAGAILGIVVHVSGVPLASGINAMVEVAGYAAIPIGLLGSGALLSLAAAQNALEATRADVALILGIKLIVLPAIAGVLALATGLDGGATVAVVLITALPSVTPRYTVLGNPSRNATLSGIATLATVVSGVTIPVTLWIAS
jgi:malonate transporter